MQIRALPIVEKWDCHGCGHCCRGTTILLDQGDLKKLEQQNWGQDAELGSQDIVVRESRFSRRRVLAKQPNGSCVFLTDEGRCRIHERFGAEAKPKVCQLFPFQTVPLGNYSYLTTRRSCPSAAAEQGRPVEQHIAKLKKSRLIEPPDLERNTPPRIAKSTALGWPQFLEAAESLAHLVTNPDLPRVVCIVQGLQFCDLLEASKLERVKPEDWTDLLVMLEKMAHENANEAFRDRQPPSRGATLLFRQLAVHYLRAHPDFHSATGWRERGRLLRAMSRFARGKGTLPPLPMNYPPCTFEDLERPLGPLPEDVSQPLNRFIESQVTSNQYVVTVGGQSLVQAYRGLAVTYGMGLWLLRLAIGQREPTTEDMVDVVVMLDRGQGLASLKRAASAMASTGQLERLVAWYTR